MLDAHLSQHLQAVFSTYTWNTHVERTDLMLP